MTKTNWIVFAFLGFSLHTFAQAAVTRVETADQIRTEFTIESVLTVPTTIAGLPFDRIEVEGAGEVSILYNEGYPGIPVLRLYVEGEVEISFKEQGESVKQLSADRLIAPVQPSTIKIRGAETPFTMIKAAYERPGFYPDVAYTVEDVGSVEGRARKLVTLHPVSYNPITSELMIRDQFVVIETLKDLNISTAALPEGFVFLVGKKFAASQALQEYVRLKQELGYKVEVVVVGTDIPNTSKDIRAKLQTLYHRGDWALKHVLIIGEATDVTGHTAQNISGLTDHYYRAIDTADYNTDINGPDIGVGRMPITDEAQLAVQVEKFKKYLNGEFSNETWLNGAAWLATDDLYEVAEGSHNYVIENYTAPLGYLGIFPQQDMAGGDQLYAITHRVTAEQTVSTLRMGRTLIQYSGHGANTFWDAPRVTQADVRSIQDANALPFVISNACITGDYQVSESFAETWVRHPEGSIMFWGSMDNTYWDEDDILEKRQHDGLYRDGLAEFGAMTNYALSETWKQYGGQGRSKYYWETYTLFGDPSVDFRTKASRTLMVIAPESVRVTDSALEVVVRDEARAPVMGARVAASLPTGRSFSVRTDAEGKALMDLTWMSRSDEKAALTLSISARDAKRYRQVVIVKP